MSKRIYVGNLPWSVGKDEFEEGFSKFGEIEEAIVISDKHTGRSRGFGFVTYKNEADADKAISEMHEKDFKGRKVLVKEARPMKKDTRPRNKDINASAGAAKTSEEKKAEKDSKDKEEKDESSEDSKDVKEESQPEKENEDGNESSEKDTKKDKENENKE